jgi:hypothetical protein
MGHVGEFFCTGLAYWSGTGYIAFPLVGRDAAASVEHLSLRGMSARKREPDRKPNGPPTFPPCITGPAREG